MTYEIILNDFFNFLTSMLWWKKAATGWYTRDRYNSSLPVETIAI